MTLMAHEVVFIPFVFLSLEPLHPAPMPSSRKHHSRGREGGKTSDGNEGLARSEDGFSTSGAGLSERSIVATFVSASHGHVVSVLQVNNHHRLLHLAAEGSTCDHEPHIAALLIEDMSLFVLYPSFYQCTE